MLTDRAEGLMRLSRITKYTTVAVACLVTAGLTAVNGQVASALRVALLPVLAMYLAHLACGPSWYSWGRTHFQSPVTTTIRITILDTLLTVLSLLAIRAIAPAAVAVTIPLRPCALTAAITLLLLNRFLPSVISTLVFQRAIRSRVLVVGPVGATQVIQRQLNLAETVGLDVFDGHERSIGNGGLRLFDPDGTVDIDHQIAQIQGRIQHPDSPDAVDRVIFVRQNSEERTLMIQQEILRRCNAAGLPLTIYTDETKAIHHPATPIHTSAPEVSRTPQEPLQNPANQVIKRCLDILISVPVVLFILPPLCLLVRIIHRIQSPGSLFFRQERCGRNGTTFRILKFRTMHVPEPGQIDIEDNPAPRIFELGAVLRDSRLDEIPQFVNVLLGQMSIVGPRAHHIQDRIRFSGIVPHYPMRMQAKPGITGPAQYQEYCGVFHRDSVESRVNCDLEYIRQWSMQTDLTLIFKTGRVIGESLFRAGLGKLRRPATPVVESQPDYPALTAASVPTLPQEVTNRQAA